MRSQKSKLQLCRWIVMKRMWRQGEEVRNSLHRAVFKHSALFASPPKGFELLLYTEGLAKQFEAEDPRVSLRPQTLDPCALQFFDECIEDSDMEESKVEGSSNSTSQTSFV